MPPSSELIGSCEENGLDIALVFEFKTYARAAGFTSHYGTDESGERCISAVWHSPYTGESIEGADIAVLGCDGYFGVSEKEDELYRQELAKATQETRRVIAEACDRLRRQPWKPDEGLQGIYAMTEKIGKVHYLRNWAGEHTMNRGIGPMQYFHEVTLKEWSLPLQAVAVELTINGQPFILSPGTTLSIGELERFLPFTQLPCPYELTCQGLPWEGYTPVVWPRIAGPVATEQTKDLVVCATRILYDMEEI
ncbi:MAG: hypothetical protein IKD01_01665 [Oscillospiraceae bacterium]|nr:hypothetical protein [Oscillospiraceae bacterium]